MRRIATLLVFLSAAACAEEKAPPPEIVRPVRWTEVLTSGSGRQRKLSGTSQAGMSSALSFKVAGTIEEITVKVGDQVDRGQIIAKLDPKDYELQVQEGRAALSQARAQQRNAKASYDRARALYENQNIAKSDLDAARTAYDSATAQVRSLSKRVELARRQLDYCKLTAPSAGAIAAVLSDENENVGAGQPIAQLSAGEVPEVLVAVPEILISRVQRGAAVTVSFDAIAGKTFGAKVFEVGVAPSQGGSTYPVTVRLNEKTDEVRPGLAAEVAFEFKATGGKDRIVVPAAAVAEDRNGRYAYVLEKTEEGFGKVKRRAVEIGDLTTEGIEIKKGLGDGDLLVTAGVSRIVDGQRVKVLEQNKK